MDYSLTYVIGAALPIIAVLVTLIFLRWPAMRAMLISLAITLFVVLAIWKMDFNFVAAALVEGVAIALSITWIVFGALALVDVLKATGHLASIRSGFLSLSPDPRIQAIVVAWCFGAFLEGASGFGAPAAITGPLLYVLGFPPVLAASLALIADSSPVSFGAAGTPVLIGLGQGISDLSVLAVPEKTVLSEQGLSGAQAIADIALRAISIDLLVGSWIPVVIVWVLLKGMGSCSVSRDLWSVLPVAMVAGFSFTGTAWLTARFLGPEFPSILGGLASLAVTVVFLKSGIYRPVELSVKFSEPLNQRPVSEKATMSAEGTAGSARDTHVCASDDKIPTHSSVKLCFMPLWQAWLPYVAVALFLVASRLAFLPLKQWLSGVVMSTGQLFGTPISASVAPLYLPGFIFVVVALATAFCYRSSLTGDAGIQRILGSLLKKILPIAATLAAAVPLVRVFIHSSGNDAGLPAMPIVLAQFASESLGAFWPLLSVSIGALGSFISGSATFSNMLFADLQAEMAVRLDIPVITVLALQMLGANAGNMVCVVNVVAAASVVGLQGKESSIIRKTAAPMFIYLTAAAIIAWLLSN